MSRHHHKSTRPLTGHFLGWGDDHRPHRYLRLATSDGEQLIKIAKSLRPQIPDWQRGVCLRLLTQETIDRDTGELKIKAKQLLTLPSANPMNLVTAGSPGLISDQLTTSPINSTTIQVCQGSSCRRSGSEQICRSMRAHLAQHNLTAQVKIEAVKCLHQCKAAPHAIVMSQATAILPGKTHYRQIQLKQVATMLSKHFPIPAPSRPVSADLIKKIGSYFNQQSISTSNSLT
jgi:Thioredoxin-like [2Fe-2S] ferredoxin